VLRRNAVIRCAACADTRRARVLADFSAGRIKPPCSGSAKVLLCSADAGSFRASLFWGFRRALCYWFCLVQFYFLFELFSLFGRGESARIPRKLALRAVQYPSPNTHSAKLAVLLVATWD